jgi:phosphoglycolate phosphatase-like HAD superfamily hydrolase
MVRKFYTLLLLFSWISAQIIESDKIAVIKEHISHEKDTLVIFDIDNTLAAPKGALGSDEWFNYLIKEKIKEGFSLIDSLHLQLPTYFYAQFNVPMVLMEEGIPAFLAELKLKGVEYMSLTTRSLYLANRTVDQLHNIGISFSLAEKIKDFPLSLPVPSIFKNGILFSGSNGKGDALICFFDSVNYHPKKVIFIDDKHENLLSVERALLKRQVEFIGIRYSGADEKVKNFNPEQAERQLLELQNYHRNI